MVCKHCCFPVGSMAYQGDADIGKRERQKRQGYTFNQQHGCADVSAGKRVGPLLEETELSRL